MEQRCVGFWACVLLLVVAVFWRPVDGAPANGMWSGMESRGTVGSGSERSLGLFDVQKQIGSIGEDLKKIITNLIGATQVVYWKYPKSRLADKKHVKKPANHWQHTSGKRRKKALNSDYDDLIALDTWGFFR